MRITYFEILEDLKREYADLRQNGTGRDAATKILIARYRNELTVGAEDDGLLFWVGLADAQYAQKDLAADVAAQGLAALTQLETAIPEIASGDLQRRRQWYACAPMPERTQVRKSRRFRCQWQMGDTFAYQLTGTEAEAKGIAGDYVLLRKVDELETDGRLTPVVTLTHWKKDIFPSNETEFQSEPILRINHGRMCSPKSTYEYRIEIMFTREKQVKDLHLQYLGNFLNIPMPKDEFYFGKAGYVTKLLPKKMDQAMCFYCYTLQNYYNQK